MNTYSCVANDNCDYEVHVIGNYRSNGHVHNTGHTDLYLTVTGTSNRPLILVLSSYEPVQWTVYVPRGVQVEKVILVRLALSNLRKSIVCMHNFELRRIPDL